MSVCLSVRLVTYSSASAAPFSFLATTDDDSVPLFLVFVEVNEKQEEEDKEEEESQVGDI